MDVEKIVAKIKHSSSDFVVEERAEKWDCHVSDNFSSNESPDISSLGSQESREFLWCEMEKKDIDHFMAIKEVAKGLGVEPRDIGYGGSKDKVAHTSQRISIFRPNLERVKLFSHEKIFLKNFKWNKRKIKLGYLDGNHFGIVLRDIDKKDAIKQSTRMKNKNWFANFFGAQRFGSLRQNNVKIGKLILEKKFEEAVWTILTDTGENERPDLRFAREKLGKGRNISEAAGYFPAFLKLEKSLLYYLKRNPEDYFGAIKRGDRKNILMYVHSVQSRIFNDILEIALGEGLDFTHEGQKSVPLVGYKTRFSKGRLGEIEKEVLDRNGLTLEDFNLREIPYLRIKGSFRRAIVEVSDLKIGVEDDEIFSGSKKMNLEFTLPSGVYATTFLEGFFVF